MPGENAFSRRAVMRAGAVAAVGFPMINSGRVLAQGTGRVRFSTKAVDIVGGCRVIDMLAPIKLDFDPKYPARRMPLSDVLDFQRSGITAIHNAVGLMGPDAKQAALTWFAGWQGFVGRNVDILSLVGSADDIDRAKREKRCAVIMGLQNSDHFERISDIELFYQLGQRCSQLTYNSQNRIGSGSTDRVDGGISDFGAEVIAEMNRVGMLVDVSHSGDRTTLDAIEASSGPIAITHSNCRALNDHPRLKSDFAITALARKGGVIGITGVRNFVRDQEPTDVGHIIDHIDHVVRLAGIEHVGIGSDSDLNGYDDMPREQYEELKSHYKQSYAFRNKIDTDGFDHPEKIYQLTDSLLKRGYSQTNIEMILGNNFYRLLNSVWK